MAIRTKMRHAISRFLLLLALVGTAGLQTGCLGGLVYTHTTTPLDVNFNRTPVVQREADDSFNRLWFYYFWVDWGDGAIGKIAKEHGMKKVHYADLETLRILGIFTQYSVHIYGE
jgi:hypothetical protein